MQRSTKIVATLGPASSEREVLKLMAQGKRNREIAEELFIAEKTVKNHVSNILWKLECNDRTQAALFAARVKL